MQLSPASRMRTGTSALPEGGARKVGHMPCGFRRVWQWRAAGESGTIGVMPRFSDMPVAIRKEGFLKFALNIWNQIADDDVFTWAAALSYSWLLALFPFLLFLLTLLPLVPEQQKGQAMQSLNEVLKNLPAESGGMVRGYVEDVLRQPRGGLMSVGLLVAIWAASGGMAQTMTAIDRCYDVEKDRPFYIQRPLAVVLTIVVAVLMFLVVAILPVGGLVLNWGWDHSVELLGYTPPVYVRVVLDVARWIMGLLLMMMVLNVVYHFGSQIRRRYRFLTPGAVFCVLLWVLMGLGFRWYVDTIASAGYNKTYGAVGGVVILLFLLYIAAVILLVGAELNSETDYTVYPVRRGERDFRPAERTIIRQEREANRAPRNDSQ